MKRAVLSFVSGAGRREENIRRAIRSVERLPATTVLAQSDLCGQVSPTDLPPAGGCVAACAVVLTGMSPCTLFGACKGIAAAMGSEQDAGDLAAAPVHISLLVYEETVCRGEELTLPNTDLLGRPWIRRAVVNIFRDGRVLGFSLPHFKRQVSAVP